MERKNKCGSMDVRTVELHKLLNRGFERRAAFNRIINAEGPDSPHHLDALMEKALELETSSFKRPHPKS